MQPSKRRTAPLILKRIFLALFALTLTLGGTAEAQKSKPKVRNHNCAIQSVDRDMMTMQVIVAGKSTEATVPYGERTEIYYEKNSKLRALDEGALVMAKGKLSEDGTSIEVGWVFQLYEGADQKPRAWKNGAVGAFKKVDGGYALEVDGKDIMIEGDKPKVRQQFPATLEDLKEGVSVTVRGRLKNEEIRPQHIAIRGVPPKPEKDESEEE